MVAASQRESLFQTLQLTAELGNSALQYLANSNAEPIGETWPSIKLKLPVEPWALMNGRLDPSPVDAKFGPLAVVKLLLI